MPLDQYFCQYMLFNAREAVEGPGWPGICLNRCICLGSGPWYAESHEMVVTIEFSSKICFWQVYMAFFIFVWSCLVSVTSRLDSPWKSASNDTHMSLNRPLDLEIQKYQLYSNILGIYHPMNILVIFPNLFGLYSPSYHIRSSQGPIFTNIWPIYC